MALRRRVSVESHGQMSRLLVADDFEQRLREAVEGGGVNAFGGEDGAGNQSEMRAVNQGHGIQEKELLRHGKRIARIKPGITQMKGWNAWWGAIERGREKREDF